MFNAIHSHNLQGVWWFNANHDKRDLIQCVSQKLIYENTYKIILWTVVYLMVLIFLPLQSDMIVIITFLLLPCIYWKSFLEFLWNKSSFLYWTTCYLIVPEYHDTHFQIKYDVTEASLYNYPKLWCILTPLQTTSTKINPKLALSTAKKKRNWTLKLPQNLLRHCFCFS